MALNEALKVIMDAEKEIRSLAVSSMKSGAYDEAIAVTELARAVSSLLEQVTAEKQFTESAAAPAPTKPPKAARPGRPSKKAGAPSEAPRRGRPPKKTVAEKPADYPRFERDGRDLIRVGWHGTRKREYRDKATRDVLDRLVNVMLKAYSKGEPFYATDSRLQLKDKDGKPVPKTKIYICMSWLKKEGLIKTEGFGPNTRYVIPDPANLKEEVRKRIAALPEKGTI